MPTDTPSAPPSFGDREAKKHAVELRSCLALIVDQVDYIGDGKNRACTPTEMVGAVLEKEILIRAKAVLEKSYGF